MSNGYYLGLMSGTSMDGIDAAMVDIGTNQQIELIGSLSLSWPGELVNLFKSLSLPGTNEIDTMGEADARAGEIFAEAALALLKELEIKPEAVKAIGCHGQTIRHRPQSQFPFTLQIGDPHRIAERTGITTIADFRRRDIAAGGEGAPLAPAFHRAIFSDSDESRVILNIGGIANITILPAHNDTEVSGFDTGPGNRLLDDWIMHQRSLPFDIDGAWAASGNINKELLERLLADDYFQRPPPKSTGSEYFNIEWLQSRLEQNIPEADVQATLLKLSTETIARAIETSAPGTRRIMVCGGGAHNSALLRDLQERLSPASVQSTADSDIDPDYVEAAAFAWLAYRHLAGLPGNLPAVTGASREVVLGSLYPA